jgi:protein TonB
MTAAILSSPHSPNKTALTAVVLIHAAALSALVLAKGPDVFRKVYTSIDTYVVPPEIPPPPKELPKPKVETPRQVIDTPVPIVDFVPKPVFIDVRPTPPETLTFATTPTNIIPRDSGPIIPPEPRKVEPAHARANLASYVSDADYPSTAIRNEEQGTTRFRLTVGADGRVTDCAVTGSSGSAALDATTCRLMRSRARFTPARDSDGRPTGDTVANAIRWVLPDA